MGSTWTLWKLKNSTFEECSMLFLQNLNDLFLDWIVTCDEKWILYDNQKQSAQWLDHDNRWQEKIMIIVWWSAIGIVYYSFLENNQSITVEVYYQQLNEMYVQLSKMLLTLFHWQGPILPHDNTQPYVTRMTLQKFTDLGYESFQHPVYSLGLSSNWNIFLH